MTQRLRVCFQASTEIKLADNLARVWAESGQPSCNMSSFDI